MRNWDDVIGEIEGQRFVGREAEINNFVHGMTLEKPTTLIFYITGQGGVGKTTLLKHFREIGKQLGLLLADSDAQERDVPTVLGRFAHQLREQGFLLRRFEERYRTYRQNLSEIEHDTNAPQGLASLFGRTMVRAIYIGGDTIPGVRKALNILPQDTIEAQAGEWVSYLVKKFANKDDLELMRNPISILSTSFFKDLNELAQKRKVLLCFDSFEVTRQELQTWLLNLREYHPSQNIRLALAGRDQPGAIWDPLRSITQVIHLDVFTQQEADIFLNRYGITNTKRRIEILEASSRLPILMGWLAAPEGKEPDASFATHDIVEHFLRWVTEPSLRQLVLIASIPRDFNIDTLKLLLETAHQDMEVAQAFDWLLTMPFVQQRSSGWVYHDVVRLMMLRYQRQKSVLTYQQIHIALTLQHDKNRKGATLNDEEKWSDEYWRQETLLYVYHHLASNSNAALSSTINILVKAFRERRLFALEMIEMLGADDIIDGLTQEQGALLRFYHRQLDSIIKGQLEDGFEMFNSLCIRTDLSSQTKGYAFAYRGECHRLKGNLTEALNDFNIALHCNSQDTRTLVRRSIVLLYLEHYQDALTDLSNAITLDEKNTWAFAIRGEVYRQMGDYQKALDNLNQALKLDEKNVWALSVHENILTQLKTVTEGGLIDNNSTLEAKLDTVMPRISSQAAAPPLVPQPMTPFAPRPPTLSTPIPPQLTMHSHREDLFASVPSTPMWQLPMTPTPPTFKKPRPLGISLRMTIIIAMLLLLIIGSLLVLYFFVLHMRPQ